MAKCEYCGKEVDLPFKCPFCGHYFCIEHRLPENHDCPNLPPRTPLGSWQTRKEMVYVYNKEKTSRFVSEGDYHFVKEIEKTEKLEKEKPFPIKKVVGLILLSILVISLVFYASSILDHITPEYTTSIYFEGLSITQNNTHLIIQDYSPEWAPFYSISFKNDTEVLNLVAYEAEGNNIVAEYAYVTRNYTKEIYPLKDIFEHLSPGEYVFEIPTHNREYNIIIDSESKKILFGNYSEVSYIYIPSLGETVYDVVFENFNETVFQKVRECIFDNDSCNDDALGKVQHLAEWVDQNIEYEFLKVWPDIYDPLTFMEKKTGVCIDYAVFYVSGLFAVGFDSAYILILNTTEELHAAAGVKHNDSFLILEQKLPIREFQNYINNFETIMGTSLQPPILVYRIKYTYNDFVIEFTNHLNLEQPF